MLRRARQRPLSLPPVCFASRIFSMWPFKATHKFSNPAENASSINKLYNEQVGLNSWDPIKSLSFSLIPPRMTDVLERGKEEEGKIIETPETPGSLPSWAAEVFETTGAGAG